MRKRALSGNSVQRESAALLHGDVRPACPEDSVLLWEWANEPDVRREAFHPEPIPLDSHAIWYAAKLADPRCLISILETKDATPVGQVRFDYGSEGLEVDVSVSSSQRRQGLGRELLMQGLEAAARRWPAGTTVVAKVLTGNQRSMRLFTRCGFIPKGIRTFRGKTFHHLERLL